MVNDLGLTGHLAELADPALRDKVVADRKAAGMGSERYGVVCGIIDPETKERCMKRICLQGLWFAQANPGQYCEHAENYNGQSTGTAVMEDITLVLAAHGLPWRSLKTRVKMHEATDKNKKKRKKSNEQAVSVVQHGTNPRDGSDIDRSSGGSAGPPQPPSLFRAYQPEVQQAYEEELRVYRAEHPDAAV